MKIDRAALVKGYMPKKEMLPHADEEAAKDEEEAKFMSQYRKFTVTL